jgi:hypothetical protein
VYKPRFWTAVVLLSLGRLAFAQTESSEKDRPSEQSARQALNAAIKGPRAAGVTVESFRKTDGLAQEVQGAKLYTLEFESTLLFGEDMLFRSRIESL